MISRYGGRIFVTVMLKENSQASNQYFERTFSRPLSHHELKTLDEIDIWYEYMRMKSCPGPNLALQELLIRHDFLLLKLAKSHHTRYNLTSDFEDKVQHARLSAMRAYDKFDIETARAAGTKLSTYVNQCAAKYLHSMNDTDSFIECPPSRRMLRSYLAGRYDGDPQKLREVERRLKVMSVDDRDELARKYSTLLPSYVSLEAPVAEFNGDTTHTYGEMFSSDDTSSEIDVKLQLQRYMENLSPRQRDVMALLTEGMKMSEIVSTLGVTENAVRGDIRTIRLVMKKCFDADNKEEASLMQNI